MIHTNYLIVPVSRSFCLAMYLVYRYQFLIIILIYKIEFIHIKSKLFLLYKYIAKQTRNSF